MSIYTTKQQKNIILWLIILLGIFIAYSLRNIFAAGLGAIVLYNLFRNPYLYFVHKRKWKPVLATFLIILISLLIIIIPFFTLGWLVIDKITYFNQNPAQLKMIFDHLSSFTGLDLENSTIAISISKNIETWVLGSFPSIINGFLNILLLISLMYFILFFMFTEHEKFESNLRKYSPFGEENYLKLAEELRKVTFSNVIGQGMIAIAQGGFVCIGFMIFNLPYPVFLGVAAAMLSFIPIVGSALVFVPAGLIALTYGNYFAGIGIILWGSLIVANIDNVIRLIINKKIANIHPIISIVGVIIGLPIFGILGLVFGPLLISYFLLLVNIYEHKVNNETSISSVKNNEK